MWRLYGELAVLMTLAFLAGALLAWGLAKLVCRDERTILLAPDDPYDGLGPLDPELLPREERR